jgi:hypothetical protein
MADEFDRFLVHALAPEERLPDRRFVGRVQALIALEEQLAAQRRSVIGILLKQVLALAAVAAAVWWVGRAAPVAGWVAESPALGLAISVTAFGLLVALLTFRPGEGIRVRFR